MVALDDLGDAGSEEAPGHSQWSIWSALAAGRSNVMASSGYDWNADAEVVLNSAVIGVPGAVLSRTMPDGSAVPAKFLDRRIALNRWYRRSPGWKPLWLNSLPGGLNPDGSAFDPVMRCMGRQERIGGEDKLTAVALREDKSEKTSPYKTLRGMTWQGRWALIAQDDESIFSSRRLACLPVDGTTLQIPLSRRPNRVLVVTRSAEAEWSDWSWKGDRVTLRCENDKEGLLGFIIVV